MNTEIESKISTVSNPSTGKSLSEESRIDSVVVDTDKVTITYERTGISPVEKREIEDKIIQALSSDFKEDNIFIKTISKDSKDVLGTSSSPQQEQSKEEPKEQAQLKTGHAQPAPKRKVEGVGKIIAVSSCKGGVGKSTVAVNLALSLKNKGYSVGLIDADIYGPSLPILLGKRGAKPEANEKKKMIPIEAHGVRFVSFGSFIEEELPVIWRGPMLGGVLNQFLFDVDWEGTDYLIIDLPPGTGDIQLSMVQATDIDGALVVSTPQTVAIHDTKKGMKMFQQVNVPIIGFIENMSYFVPEDAPNKMYYIFGQGGVSKMTEEVGTEFLGEIPLVTSVREGADVGQPFMGQESNSGSDVWKSYMAITEKLEDFFKKKDNKGKGFFSNLFK
ncbi:MAG: Mrp/NBP35 family ATP-binding protein [Bacteriovoracaceae bacterium]|nr:Mrp/NBP35 family ATP-binding protein [Bacteriovoracaceae bacterium]